jgi:peptidoglycan/xylan/chitin deacetylase (PgdA/CDA1 family)
MPLKPPALYLTYDDGPQPGVTTAVLSLLAEAGARATFFCQGSQAAQYPELLLEIRSAGHVIGSHTYSHLNGLKTSSAHYLADAVRGLETLDSILGIPARLFRPPYGRPNPCLTAFTVRYRQRIVLWTHILYDWDARQPILETIRYIKTYVRAGDIIVLHDSSKAQPRVVELTKVLLTHACNNNWAVLPLS